MLQHSVKGHRQTGEERNGNDAVELSLCSQVESDQEKEQDVAKCSIGALHSQVFPPQAEARIQRGDGSEKINSSKEEGWDDKGYSEEIMEIQSRRSTGFLRCQDPINGEAHEPGGQHEEGDEAE